MFIVYRKKCCNLHNAFMVRRLGLGKNNHLTYASLALNPRYAPSEARVLKESGLGRLHTSSVTGHEILSQNLCTPLRDAIRQKCDLGPTPSLAPSPLGGASWKESASESLDTSKERHEEICFMTFAPLLVANWEIYLCAYMYVPSSRWDMREYALGVYPSRGATWEIALRYILPIKEATWEYIFGRLHTS